MKKRPARTEKQCPSCGFWLETVAEAHAPSRGISLHALGSIPFLGSILGLFMLRNDLNQMNDGPYWCWRCKREVSVGEITDHAP